MKILHLSTSDIDGGAARAAYRLHRGLIEANVDSKMLVRAKFGEDSTVLSNKTPLARLGSKLDALPLNLYPERDSTMFSPQWFPDSVVTRVKQLNPDIIHLHWVCNGFLKIESLAKFHKPIVWTMHDMWSLTGGCHYTKGCDRYTEGCGSCPQLKSNHFHDLSRRTWKRKAKAWQSLNMTLVTPSKWLAKCTQASPLFEQYRIEVIPNGIDTQQYQPLDTQIARDKLNLPQDKYLVLFGAGSTSGDPRKGFRYLLSALKMLNADRWSNQLELVIFGESEAAEPLPIRFKTHYLGRLNDDISLAAAYSAADVFISPSVQDNLPNTVVEALACGTPCIAFDIGGMPDLIQHQHNGYIAKPFDIDDLANGIAWLLEDDERRIELSKKSHAYALRNFELKAQSNRYLQLYEYLLAGSKRYDSARST